MKKKGLRFGRRFVGMFGLGVCGILILLAAILPDNTMAAYCLIAANGFFSLVLWSLTLFVRTLGETMQER